MTSEARTMARELPPEVQLDGAAALVERAAAQLQARGVGEPVVGEMRETAQLLRTVSCMVRDLAPAGGGR